MDFQLFGRTSYHMNSYGSCVCRLCTNLVHSVVSYMISNYNKFLVFNFSRKIRWPLWLIIIGELRFWCVVVSWIPHNQCTVWVIKKKMRFYFQQKGLKFPNQNKKKVLIIIRTCWIIIISDDLTFEDGQSEYPDSQLSLIQFSLIQLVNQLIVSSLC